MARYLDNDRAADRRPGPDPDRSATTVSRDVEAQLRGAFGDLVCRTTIPGSAKVGEAHARFLSVLDYAPRSAGAKAYEALVAEIVGHGDKSKTGLGSLPAGLLRPTTQPARDGRRGRGTRRARRAG